MQPCDFRMSQCIVAKTLSPVSEPAPTRVVLFASRVPAGFPSPAEDHAEARLDLNEHLIDHPTATFFVRVSGESMLGAGIHDGDLLIVDRSLTPADGDIVIAVIDGEHLVKRLSLTGTGVSLLSENPAFRPIRLSSEQQLHIWGVVRHCVTSFRRGAR